jgi:hypothetical protein
LHGEPLCPTQLSVPITHPTHPTSKPPRTEPIPNPNQDDLAAIRSLYPNQISYIEADLTAYATPTPSSSSASSSSAGRPARSRRALLLVGPEAGDVAPPSYAPLPVLEGADGADTGRIDAAESSAPAHNATAAAGCDVFSRGDDGEGAAAQPAGDEGRGVRAAADVWAQAGARSWGQDRMDQVHLPMDGAYSPGDLDGRGVHGESAGRCDSCRPCPACLPAMTLACPAECNLLAWSATPTNRPTPTARSLRPGHRPPRDARRLPRPRGPGRHLCRLLLRRRPRPRHARWVRSGLGGRGWLRFEGSGVEVGVVERV